MFNINHISVNLKQVMTGKDFHVHVYVHVHFHVQILFKSRVRQLKKVAMNHYQAWLIILS